MSAWALLLLLTALGVHGFASEGLFSQTPLWYPQGWRRLAVFTGGFAVWTLAISLRWRRWFGGITFLALLLLSAFTFGPAAVLAVLLFLTACLHAGRSLGVEDWGLATAAGLGIFILVAYCMACMAPWPVNQRGIWLFLLTWPIRNFGGGGATLREQFARGGSSPGIAIAFLLALHWMVAANPEVSSDGLAMHLAIPAKVRQLGYWPFDTSHTTWAVMPMGADWCYTIVYLFGGEAAARLLNFSFAAIAAGLIYSGARRWLDERGAAWIVALYLSSPMVHLVTGNLFVETAWALLPMAALLALWRFEESGERRALFLCAWLLGCGGMVKLGALGFAAAMLPFVLYATWKHRPRHAWFALPLLLVPASIPYVIAYRVTGNPVFPFTGSAAVRPGLDFLYQLTFRTPHWLESQSGAFGFQYFLLAPLLPCLIRRNWGFREWSTLGTGFLATAIISWSQPNARYLYPSLGFLSLWIAIVLARFPAAKHAAAACFALNLYFLPASSFSNKIFAVNPLSAADREEFLRTEAPARALVDWLNQQPSKSPVLFAGLPQIAGLDAPAYTDTWHHQPFLDRLSNANDDPSLLCLFRETKISRVIAPRPGSGRYLNHIPLQSFLERWTTRGPENGGYAVALLSDSPGKLPPSPALGPGLHDDTAPGIRYTGAWRRDTSFVEASGRTLAYVNGPGTAARFSFEGAAFTWIHTRAHNRGTAAVSIDGRAPVEAALHAPVTRWRQELRFVTAPGRHTVEIRNAGSAYIDVDAIRIE